MSDELNELIDGMTRREIKLTIDNYLKMIDDIDQNTIVLREQRKKLGEKIEKLRMKLQ